MENLNTGEIILEELQNKLSEQWKSNLEGLRELGDKVQDLHASFLFYRNANSEVAKLCTEAYKVLILMIGGTPKSNMFDGWKEFGINLDLHLEDINYIENGLNTMCCTEAVLRVFIQDEEATLDKIANALVKMDRFDILQNLKIILTELPRLLKNEESNSDVGYISSSWSSNTTGVIIKPVFVANNLPEVLKLADSNQQKDFNIGSTNSFEYSDGINNCSKRNQVLLTFAKSGSYIANHICHTVKNRFPYIDIFTLEDKRQEIQVDTDNYVKRYCTEVDYICPIITEDYLHKISNTQNDEPGENFDLKYARFIYTLITSRYIHETGCCNVKVRPILPSYADDRTIMDVCRHQILTQYIWEDDFQTFLKVCFKNNTQ